MVTGPFKNFLWISRFRLLFNFIYKSLSGCRELWTTLCSWFWRFLGCFFAKLINFYILVQNRSCILFLQISKYINRRRREITLQMSFQFSCSDVNLAICLSVSINFNHCIICEFFTLSSLLLFDFLFCRSILWSHFTYATFFRFSNYASLSTRTHLRDVWRTRSFNFFKTKSAKELLSSWVRIFANRGILFGLRVELLGFFFNFGV